MAAAGCGIALALRAERGVQIGIHRTGDMRLAVLLQAGGRLHQVEAAVEYPQRLVAALQFLKLTGGYQRGVHQCSSAGACGTARSRSTVAAMPLARISVMPAQPSGTMWSPNSATLYIAPNTMPEYCRLATTSVAPWAYARVMHSWPSDASTPTGISHSADGQSQGDAPVTKVAAAPASTEPTEK